jgi:choline dehydrogenase
MRRGRTSDEVDYVVVGGGSAGCVIANRLSGDAANSVILLEAGGWDRHPLIRIPAGIAKMPAKYDWQYRGEPDPSRGGLVDPWASGKVLGGGSSINMMFWVRGAPADYDGWRDQGCHQWGYQDVLPYFERAETYADGPSPRRGDSGPVGVSKVSTDLEVLDDFLHAAEAAGHSPNDDYNGDRQLGVSLAQVSQRRGFRSSTARAYLAPARRRSNLMIHTSALAVRVIFEGTRAVGVEYRHGGKLRIVRARREIVLCAGALASPKLLMLSGVGPADHLHSHGIDVIRDLVGVGGNLQEHAYGVLQYRTIAGTLAEETSPLRAIKHAMRYALKGTGALTLSGAAAVVFAQYEGHHPTETEIIFIPIGMSFSPSPSGDDGLQHDIHDFAVAPHGLTIYPSDVHPQSRGQLRLSSAIPDAYPIIDHELLGNPRDLRALIAACRQGREIMATPDMKAKLTGEVLPGSGVQTEEEWAAFLRGHAFRANHPVGTCRMGSDEHSVVDTKLRVRGVDSLRVVDASIFPTITSGNTNAPTIMVAERAADLILSGEPSCRQPIPGSGG